VAADEDMRRMIDNANITKAQLSELILKVCSGKLSAEGENFIKLLVENRRLDVLQDIADQYEALKAEAEKTIEAEVVSAFKITEAQEKMLAKKLKARLGRDVSLNCRVDETLLGGIIIKAGDLVIDGSSKGHIQKLSIKLAS
jgi:F-type H+-transporting ATPase subunit delta